MKAIHASTPGQCPPLNFEEVVLPYLDAAYRLARCLTGGEHDAEDVVQEAALRAFRYFRTFSGGNGRAWFLRIVRHVCYDYRGYTLKRVGDTIDEEQYASETTASPEMLLLQEENVSLIEDAMSDLPERFRELLVLRELEGLSYQELANVLRIPIGTVMSGLSRARQALRRALAAKLDRRERHSNEAAVAQFAR